MNIIIESIIKQSPLLGLLLIFWIYQRSDFKDFVDKITEENFKREQRMQETIAKNQEVIMSLSNNVSKIDKIEEDVKYIKNKLN